MYGRRVKIGIVFESPEDDMLTIDFEEGSQAEFDKACMVTAFAQMTVTRRGGHAEAVVTMSKDELRRHIYESRAVLKSMDAAAKLADREWARYRVGVRRKQNDQG